MKCLKRNFKEDFLEFTKHFCADSKESTERFYEVKSWATMSKVTKQMEKLSTQWETDRNGSTTFRRDNQMSVFHASEEHEKKVLWGENKSNSQQSWSLCKPRLQGIGKKEIKLGSKNRRQLLKLRNIIMDVVKFRQILDVKVKSNRLKRMPGLQPWVKRVIIMLAALSSYSTLEKRTDNAKKKLIFWNIDTFSFRNNKI